MEIEGSKSPSLHDLTPLFKSVIKQKTTSWKESMTIIGLSLLSCLRPNRINFRSRGRDGQSY